LLIPRPPSTINGDVIVTIIPSYHVKIKQITQEKNSPSAASVAIPRLSVVRPFTALMSSVNILVRMPGARFLLSNQPMCFDRYA
jgi:hypothetical protein